MNPTQRKISNVASILILITWLFRAYIEWQKIKEEPVGGNVTSVAVVLSWALNSIISTVVYVFFPPLGILAVVLFGYLYYDSRTQLDRQPPTPPEKPPPEDSDTRES